MLSWRERCLLGIQRVLAQAFAPLTWLLTVGWMRLGRRYRILDRSAVRRRFRDLLVEGDGPVIVCANHLTVIDSLLLIWALASVWNGALKSALFPWNVPEKSNYYKNPLLCAFCYLGKCLPIVRRGPRVEIRKVLDRVAYLLTRGESVMLFPEGGRSRSGRVSLENFAYGVGTVLQEVPRARVLCVYLRGVEQGGFCDLPPSGERFYVDLKMLTPRTEQTGRRGARDLATQVVETLVEMECRYFEKSA